MFVIDSIRKDTSWTAAWACSATGWCRPQQMTHDKRRAHRKWNSAGRLMSALLTTANTSCWCRRHSDAIAVEDLGHFPLGYRDPVNMKDRAAPCTDFHAMRAILKATCWRSLLEASEGCALVWYDDDVYLRTQDKPQYFVLTAAASSDIYTIF